MSAHSSPARVATFFENECQHWEWKIWTQKINAGQQVTNQPTTAQAHHLLLCFVLGQIQGIPFPFMTILAEKQQSKTLGCFACISVLVVCKTKSHRFYFWRILFMNPWKDTLSLTQHYFPGTQTFSCRWLTYTFILSCYTDLFTSTNRVYHFMCHTNTPH